jgi:hypothetical protein
VRKKLTALLLAAGLATTLTACTGTTAEEEARNKLQEQKSQGETLEKKNLEEKRKREENPAAIAYVYKYTNTGAFIGYWVAKGKISSNGSQRTPMQDIVWTCKSGYSCTPVVVDGPQDDGSYGGDEPGVFFFLADCTKVVLGDDQYLYSDRPLDLPNIPQLLK